MCRLWTAVVGLGPDSFNTGVTAEDGVWLKGWTVFPASCKVVHVVCVFPAEEIRVRLLMFFKSEALTSEEGKEQERGQPLSKRFAERVLTGVGVSPPPGAAGATTAVTLAAPVLMLRGQESPVDLEG